MAKTAKKSTANKATAKAKGGKKKGAVPKIQLTWLAMALLAVTLVWFLIGGFFATNDLLSRRANCLDWLVQQNSSIQGYKRVFNTDSERFGCSLQKLGLRGFMAKPPIYPDILGLLLVFGPPAGMMGFYLMAFKFRRGWILRGKKKVWAKTGPMDLDDFEDMRDLPDEEEIRAMDEADAAANMSADEAMDAALNDTANGDPKPVQKPEKPSAAAKPAPAKAPTKPKEKPKEELSELEKILRQVDD